MSGGSNSAALDQKAADPYAKGGGRHGFWWADQTYIRPGLYFRRVRLFGIEVRLWTRVWITTAGKDSFGCPTRWRILKAAFARPGKDVFLGH